jgi:hypothetical protein
MVPATGPHAPPPQLWQQSLRVAQMGLGVVVSCQVFSPIHSKLAPHLCQAAYTY